MILALPAGLFLLALALTYRTSGIWRTALTLLMLAAVAAAVTQILDPVSGIALVAGPAIATLVLRRAPRTALDFETLSRRAIAFAAAVMGAIFAATKFPVAENAVALDALPWLLASVGAAWMLRPLDAEERIQGIVFLIAGGAALLTAAIPSGPVTAGLAGSMALLPVIARSWPMPMRLGDTSRTVLVGIAGLCALAAVSPFSLPRVPLGDLVIGLDGPILVGAATLLLAGILIGRRVGWALIPGIVSLLGTAPAVRWAGLAALVSVLTVEEAEGERPAWIALGLLGISPLFTALVLQPWSGRAAGVLLASALVVVTVSIRRLPWGGLALAASTFAVLLSLRTMAPNGIARFQWIAAAGAVLVIARPVLSRGTLTTNPDRVREALLAALLLLAVSSHDALALGVLAAVLLIVDLCVVLPSPARVLSRPIGWSGRIDLLARSNWPPSVTFAAGVLTVTAALQASLALGLFAGALLAGLQLAPYLDRQVAGVSDGRTVRDWLAPAVSLACGVAPALVLRMLRL